MCAKSFDYVALKLPSNEVINNTITQVGRWNDDSHMASGQKATLETAICQNGICVPQFSVPSGPEVIDINIPILPNSASWPERDDDRTIYRCPTVEAPSIRLDQRLWFPTLMNHAQSR